MKCADYIAEFLAKRGFKDVFAVTGGAIAHTIDAIGRRSASRGDVSYTCVVHEQAGAMAAEAYSRLSQGIGVVMATSGPGATNLITGICGSWFDSIPALFITGQVGRRESVAASDANPRQVGFQETDIISIAKPVTKYARAVEYPEDIRYVLEEAIYIARSGRPGPVLVDIPIDVQMANIEPSKLKSFSPKDTPKLHPSATVFKKKVKRIVALLAQAKRPVILLGGGVRIAGAENAARDLSLRIGAPVVLSWSGFDLLPDNFPLLVGHVGIYGSRGANFTVQNADLVLSIGSRLDTRQTGSRPESFARAAKIVMVDIDANEIKKGRGLSVDVGVVAEAGAFIKELRSRLPKRSPRRDDWFLHVRAWQEYRYPESLCSKRDNPMSAYPALRALSDSLAKNDVVIADEGGNLVWTMQSFRIKDGQRLISTFGNSPMGYALPAAIGAARALPGKRIVCIDGDGGFQLNIQELQTIRYYDLPIKIFIINNESMGIIKQFQEQYFDGRFHASSPDHGYRAPDFVKIARAYGIPALRARRLSEIKAVIRKALAQKGPVLVDVRVDEKQELLPKVEFGRPIEDMSPYLDRDVLKKLMLIDLLPESKDIPRKKPR
ncbi:thiamine pyrophosphate-binding protein [Candidatus Kaiserbacteria bacterium]|nr:thiamine pyrophosphate-binding protein [Candidatus Kaiserbacteria bacterium]